jgi:hypothetical protein
MLGKVKLQPLEKTERLHASYALLSLAFELTARKIGKKTLPRKTSS